MKKWRIYSLSLFTFFLGVVFLLAYRGIIPTSIASIPYYDSIGHFVLYGIWAYLCASVFRRPIVPIGKLRIPIGVFIVMAVAVSDEGLQALSPIRTASMSDLGWGISGIVLAIFIWNYQTRKDLQF